MRKNRFALFSLSERILAAFCAACFVMLSFAGCESSAEDAAESDKNLPEIVIGSDSFPPYNYEDADGRLTGIDVDLATEAFCRMGYNPNFVLINWEEKKELVESGEIDCIWGSFSIDGRENQYNWSAPYMYSRQVVAVIRDSDINSLADLEGCRIAVQSTTKPEEIFLSHSDPRIPEIGEIFSLQNRELIYPYLSKGYVDAIAAHETSILQCMEDYDLDYRILDEPLLIVGLGVAFSIEDNRGINLELSKVFAEMKNDGTLERILGKYLENPQKYLEADGYEK